MIPMAAASGTPVVPAWCNPPLSLAPARAETKHEALAEEVLRILRDEYELPGVHLNGDARVVCLSVCTGLTAWFWPHFVRWQTGRRSSRTHRAVWAYAMIRGPLAGDAADMIARRLAYRAGQLALPEPALVRAYVGGVSA